MGIQGIIAINKKTIHNFEIFIEDDYGRNNEKKILQTSHKNFISSIIEAAVQSVTIRQRSIKHYVLTIKMKNM